MPDAILMICNRCDDMPIAPVPHATRTGCWKCGKRCWISPATLARTAGRKWKAECLQCASKRGPGTLQPLPASAGQVAEIRAALQLDGDDAGHA